MGSSRKYSLAALVWISLVAGFSPKPALAGALRPAQPAGVAVVTDMGYARPHRLVAINGNRTMNIFCVGRGSPSVILEAGLGDTVRAWATVQAQLGRRTRTCSYDRAGLGFSAPSSRPGTAANAVEDLHELLTAAGVAPPYVLVGHSLGGLYTQLYADKYRAQVAGMVLIDPVSDEQGRRFTALDPTTKSSNERYVADIHDICIPAARAGLTKSSPVYRRCVPPPDPHFSRALNASFEKMASTARYMAADWSEWSNVFSASSDEVRLANRGYGKMPLIVLTSMPGRCPPKVSRLMCAARHRLWLSLHEDIAKMSTRGVDRIVPGTGHYIQFDQPLAVVDAVSEVIHEAVGQGGPSLR